MPKVSDAHRAHQRSRIIAATMATASAKGLANTSMSEIIRESGLSAGAIYGYYASKDELIADVADLVISGRLQVMAQPREPLPSPSEMLTELVTSAPTDLIDSGLIVEIWSQAPHSPGIQRIATAALERIRNGWQDYLTQWLIQQGQRPSDAQARASQLTPALVGLAQGYFLGLHLGVIDSAEYLASVDALLASI